MEGVEGVITSVRERVIVECVGLVSLLDQL